MLSDEEWKDLETEFEFRYHVLEGNPNMPGFKIEGLIKGGKFDKRKIKIDLVLKENELLGTHTKKYEGRFKELKEKIENLISRNELGELSLETTIENNCYFFSHGGKRVGIAAVYGFAAKDFHTFRAIATKIYGY
jgi:hypothetical protein